MQQEKTKTVKLLSPGTLAAMIALSVLLLVCLLAFFSAAWYVRIYGRIGFDSILFTLTSSLGGVDAGLIRSYLLGAALPAAGCTVVLALVLFWRGRPLVLRGRKLLPMKLGTASIISLVLCICLLLHAAFNSQLIGYISASFSETELYEAEYRDPTQVAITFPEQKRNLIYIMLESMETSYQDTAAGGALAYNLIPELSALARSNINFSHNDGVGGFREVTGASWTVGAMVAQTAGVPLKVPDGISDWQNGYGKGGMFLPELTSLTSILHQHGYYQALMVGSDANFGGRKTYFSTHGMDKIYDLYTAWNDGTVEYGYWNDWWGDLRFASELCVRAEDHDPEMAACGVTHPERGGDYRLHSRAQADRFFTSRSTRHERAYIFGSLCYLACADRDASRDKGRRGGYRAEKTLKAVNAHLGGTDIFDAPDHRARIGAKCRAELLHHGYPAHARVYRGVFRLVRGAKAIGA